MPLILAGDVGGTKTILALYSFENGTLQRLSQQKYWSKDFTSLEAVLKNFLTATKIIVSTAVLGVPGPVIHNVCKTPNLPWTIDGNSIAKKFRINNVKILNDFYAFGNGVELLPSSDFLQLNTAPLNERKVRAFIGAGTGLGEAVAAWFDGYRVYPSEGGHCDFAPRTTTEIQLLQYLLKKLKHVSFERLLSGRGLTTIYRFLQGKDFHADEDMSITIVQNALDKKDPLAQQAVDLFLTIYGAEAGNLALKAKALGGIYIGGGIARAILPMYGKKIFLHSFYDKGRLSYLMKKIPVFVVMNQEIGALGAANYARKFFFSDIPAEYFSEL